MICVRCARKRGLDIRGLRKPYCWRTHCADCGVSSHTALFVEWQRCDREAAQEREDRLLGEVPEDQR